MKMPSMNLIILIAPWLVEVISGLNFSSSIENLLNKFPPVSGDFQKNMPNLRNSPVQLGF